MDHFGVFLDFPDTIHFCRLFTKLSVLLDMHMTPF